MDRVICNSFVHRAAGLLDRRPLVGGSSDGFLSTAGWPPDATARKRRHRRGRHWNQGAAYRGTMRPG